MKIVLIPRLNNHYLQYVAKLVGRFCVAAPAFMLPLFFCGLFSESAHAAPPLVTNVQVLHQTKSSASIFWTTNVATSSTAIKFGETSAYGSQVAGPAGTTYHEWFLTSLAAGTTYNFCIQATAAGESSQCNGSSGNNTFTTLPATNPAVADPVLPLQTTDTTMPMQSGLSRTVNSTDCNDPLTGLQALINTANLGDTIIIPAGMVCTGNYTLKNKTTGSGWIVIKSSSADSLREGVRISPSQRSSLATIRNNAFGPRTVRECLRNGDITTDYWSTSPGSGFPLYRCNQNLQPIRINADSGVNIPNSCTEGGWFYKTDAPHEESVYLCAKSNEYVKMNLTEYAGTRTNIIAEAGAHHYRLIGLELTTVPQPYNSLLSGLCTTGWVRGCTHYGSSYTGMVYTAPTSHHIILDRIYMHGHDYPGRIQYAAFYANGDHIALIDSFVDQINFWVDRNQDFYFAETSSIYIASGRFGKFHNNYLSAQGINVFFPDEAGEDPSPSDHYFTRNHLYNPNKYRWNHPDSDGHRYMMRHHFEIKAAKRIVLDGNILDNTWMEGQVAGPLIVLTPRPGNPDRAGITDVLISNNILRNAPNAIVAGSHSTPGTWTSQRFKIHNNLIYNIDAYEFYVPNNFRQPGWGGYIVMQGDGNEDLKVTNNTVGPNYRGEFAGWLVDPGVSSGSGLVFTDNVMVYGDSIAYGGFTLNSLQGTAALNATWRDGPGNPRYAVTGNVFIGRPEKASNYPPGNSWVSSPSDVGFRNSVAGDFTITNPTYRLKGVDMTSLIAATGSVISGNSPPAPPTSLRIQ